MSFSACWNISSRYTTTVRVRPVRAPGFESAAVDARAIGTLLTVRVTSVEVVVNEKKLTSIDALISARAMLRVAEQGLVTVHMVHRAYTESTKRHIVNARAEVDEALQDLRGEGRVD